MTTEDVIEYQIIYHIVNLLLWKKKNNINSKYFPSTWFSSTFPTLNLRYILIKVNTYQNECSINTHKQNKLIRIKNIFTTISTTTVFSKQ